MSTPTGMGRSAPDSGAAPLFLTSDSREKLAARVGELEGLAAALLEKLRGGDTDDVTAVEYGRTLDEVTRLKSALTEARPVDELPEDPRRVVLGDTVTVHLADGAAESYVVVHPLEAPYDDVLISSASPLGRAVLGRRVGDEVDVIAPAGTYRCTIVSADRR